MRLYKKVTIFLFVFLFGISVHAQINVSNRIIESTVGLLWEASSYTPPFYKGKALYGKGTRMVIVAYPPSSLGNPDSLTYTWKKDGIVDGEQSGVGKQSFTLYEKMFGDTSIVVVEISNGTEKEYGALSIHQETPFILFYEHRPLDGVVLEKALFSDIIVKPGSFTLEAYPYFFSGTSRMSDSLTYSWSVNHKKIEGANGPSLSLESLEKSSVLIEVSVNNPDHILEYARNTIKVSFE
jgi:hypothetical protein